MNREFVSFNNELQHVLDLDHELWGSGCKSFGILLNLMACQIY